MPYRNPDPARMEVQKDRAFTYAGQSATWRRWVSATPAVPAAGIAARDYFAERPITALFGQLEQVETQTPAGMIIATMVQCTTVEPLGRQDELIWRGITYEVDSDAMQARMGGGWITVLKRATP